MCYDHRALVLTRVESIQFWGEWLGTLLWIPDQGFRLLEGCGRLRRFCRPLPAIAKPVAFCTGRVNLTSGEVTHLHCPPSFTALDGSGAVERLAAQLPEWRIAR